MNRRALAMAAPMAAAAAPPAENLALAATGAAAMAEGGKVGTLFRYVINQPVTVPRKRSAMIPIIGTSVEGEKVSVYNASADAKHPMNGIKLKNTTGLHLMGGPITVFDSGIYGGDALIEDVTPGEERLLTYAMDLAVEVEPQTQSAPEQLLSAKIVNGVLTLTHKQRQETTYLVKNRAKEKRTVLIEHPLRQDWKLVEPKEADERTRNAYRFKVIVDADKSEKLLVAEEMPQLEVVQLARTDLDSVRLLIARKELSPELKAALQKLADLQAALADITSKRADREARIKDIDAEQNRIRQNMRELDRQSELYKQYVQKLTTQEAELDQLREEVRTLRANEAAQKKTIADYVAGLNV
jgi:flagellin-like hook-associated protein FlgL